MIKDRKGSFPGMLQNRTFNVVLVSNNNGIGMQMPVKLDKVIQYTGKAVNYMVQ
jgi:alpha-D-xyloside xylohydrolase